MVAVRSDDPSEPFWLAKIENVAPTHNRCSIFWFEKSQTRNQRATYSLKYTKSAKTGKTVPWDDTVEIKALMGYSFVLEDDKYIPYDMMEILNDEVAKVSNFRKRQVKYKAKETTKSTRIK